MITLQPLSILQRSPVLNLSGGVHHIPGKAAEDSFSSFKTSSGCKQPCLSDPQSGALKMLRRDIQSTRWLHLIRLTMRISKVKFCHLRQLNPHKASPHLHSRNPVINLASNCLLFLALETQVAPFNLPRCHPLSMCTLGESLTVRY